MAEVDMPDAAFGNMAPYQWAGQDPTILPFLAWKLKLVKDITPHNQVLPISIWRMMRLAYGSFTQRFRTRSTS